MNPPGINLTDFFLKRHRKFKVQPGINETETGDPGKSHLF